MDASYGTYLACTELQVVYLMVIREGCEAWQSLGNKVAPCFPKASGLLICGSSHLHVQPAPFGLQKVDDIPHKFPTFGGWISL